MVRREFDPLAPSGLIPVAFDQPAHEQRAIKGKIVAVGQTKELGLRPDQRLGWVAFLSP